MIIWSYGLMLVLPVFLSILVASVLRLSALTLVLPLLGIVVSIFLLPFGFGNAYAAKLIGSIAGAAPRPEDHFFVQLTLSPRIRSGLRAFAEDADDLGQLSFTDSALLFRGDSVTLSVPFTQIQSIESNNVGWRGLFVYGRRLVVVVSGLPNVTAVEFAERSSWLLPTSRKITRQLYARLSTAAAKP
jgi:hypothetical protein